MDRHSLLLKLFCLYAGNDLIRYEANLARKSNILTEPHFHIPGDLVYRYKLCFHLSVHRTDEGERMITTYFRKRGTDNIPTPNSNKCKNSKKLKQDYCEANETQDIKSSLDHKELVSGSIGSTDRAEVKQEETTSEKVIKGDISDITELLTTLPKNVSFKSITSDNLELEYCKVFSCCVADKLLQSLESSIVYDDESKVKIFGKLYDVPRKQTAFGDSGLSYTFSGVTVPAKTWIPCLKSIKQWVEACCGSSFNFVLVNRYESGTHYMGEHRDDEKDLVDGHMIASLSFGQPRDFVFRHKDARGRDRQINLEPIKILLEHGSLLIMKEPTNKYWYHSLPKRSFASAPRPRINLTFRKMVS